MENLPRRTVLFGAITSVLYLVLFFFDRDIDGFLHAHFAGTGLFKAGGVVSEFAYGAYYTFALALCFLLIVIVDSVRDTRWTRPLLFICLSVSIAIILGEGLKYGIGRYRPVMYFEKELYGFSSFSAEWELHSSPSGHTFRAFALFTALSLLFRRLTPLFIGIAVLIALSRVVVTAHYPSDVLLGAFVGTFTALWVHSYFYRPNEALVK